MKNFVIKITGLEELEDRLIGLQRVRFDAVVTKNVTQLFNRAKSNARNTVGGTPVDTGELRKWITKNKDGITYTKEYAPHVEYGHRTRNGGYVPGQRFLRKNVEIQREIYEKDLLNAIKKEGG